MPQTISERIYAAFCLHSARQNYRKVGTPGGTL